MISIPKMDGRIATGVALCLTLSGTTQAAETINLDECSEITSGQRDSVKCEEDRKRGIDTVKGEVLHIEPSKYVVQRFYGKEIELSTDASTQVTGTIDLGNSIEARVANENDAKHALSMRELGK